MRFFFLPFIAGAVFLCSCALFEKDAGIVEKTSGLVAFWDFSDNFKSKVGNFDMRPFGNMKISDSGPISGRSAEFDGSSYLSIPYEQTKELNVKNNAVTVVSWVNWTGNGVAFIGGMWNEFQDGGKRQYGLFISLPYYNGADQVCGHISKTGGPTRPFPFSIDYSASSQKVPKGKWVCAAFTYDGKYIRSYLNGEFIERPKELIKHTKGFPGYPDGLVQSKNPYYYPDGIGDNGSDFTMGAVLLKGGMGNFFKGKIGGLAVYNRALSAEEIRAVSRAYPLD